MNNLKEVNIKKQRTCYYLDETVKIEYFDFDNMLLYEKVIRKYFGLLQVIQNFDWCKLDGFIRIYHGTRYLVLFGSEKI